MKIGVKFRRFIYWGHLDKAKVNEYQKIIRDSEWNSIESYIGEKSKFLDVGCGSGYSLLKAITSKSCEAFGIDPTPNSFGVKFNNGNLNIIQGSAEAIPFEDGMFDVVYSSHVIEHVNDIDKSLEEFHRVLKAGGKAIILVPTSQSAWINFISSLIFTTHLRILRYIARPITKSKRTKLKHIFLTYSHGKEEKTVFYDIKHYKIAAWKKVIEKHFKIQHTILPFFYPFPDYIQLFKAHKNKKYGSSVAFICEKK
jgi:ubiquinone/menaquinone biosynthesis C-methylase UbiE